MNKQQAIQLLDQAVSQLQTTRQNHQALVAALQFLGRMEEVKPILKEVKSEKDASEIN